MVAENVAKKIIETLSDLPGFPDEKRKRHYLKRVLMDNCSSEEHAERAVDSALEHGNGFCPKPGDLIEACRRTGPAFKDPSEGCERCGGNGFIIIRVLSTVRNPNEPCHLQRISQHQEIELRKRGFKDDPLNQQIVDAAQPCPECRA